MGKTMGLREWQVGARHVTGSKTTNQWLNSAGTGQNGVLSPVSGVPPPEIAVPPPGNGRSITIWGKSLQ